MLALSDVSCYVHLMAITCTQLSGVFLSGEMAECCCDGSRETRKLCLEPSGRCGHPGKLALVHCTHQYWNSSHCRGFALYFSEAWLWFSLNSSWEQDVFNCFKHIIGCCFLYRIMHFLLSIAFALHRPMHIISTQMYFSQLIFLLIIFASITWQLGLQSNRNQIGHWS